MLALLCLLVLCVVSDSPASALTKCLACDKSISTAFVAERSLLALQLVVVLSFPALALAAPSGFATSLESRVQKLEDTVFTKNEAKAMENARKTERLDDIKRMDAKMKADITRMDAKMKATEDGRKAERLADIKRMDAASDRTFALSFASFAIASSASLKAAADVLMRRELAPRA